MIYRVLRCDQSRFPMEPLPEWERRAKLQFQPTVAVLLLLSIKTVQVREKKTGLWLSFQSLAS
jgi:hypothetical protein